MKQLNFASIDIGSNAIRFLLCYVFETPQGPFFRKGILLRVPLRLGDDAFKLGRISKEKEKKMIETMLCFKHLMATQEIIDYKALATSAMRDASNGKKIVAHIAEEVGIDIQIVSGEEEANVISGDSKPPEFLHTRGNLLYVDVGGGSTEMTFHTKKKTIRESFNIGTIRYLTNQVDEAEWLRLKEWLKEHNLYDSGVNILGSGGNINKIYKIKRRRSADFHLNVSALEEYYNLIKDLSYEERIIQHNLNPDRADVIIPASQIFLRIIEKTKSKRIYVPKTGLSDGIVRSLYANYKSLK
ncbi:MAG: hypothetical protein H6607_05635 [Flavobacteriales bacterium]|nr:hypothetical protein [Flavobacteriales bacterium]